MFIYLAVINRHQFHCIQPHTNGWLCTDIAFIQFYFFKKETTTTKNKRAFTSTHYKAANNGIKFCVSNVRPNFSFRYTNCTIHLVKWHVLLILKIALVVKHTENVMDIISKMEKKAEKTHKKRTRKSGRKKIFLSAFNLLTFVFIERGENLSKYMKFCLTKKKKWDDGKLSETKMM